MNNNLTLVKTYEKETSRMWECKPYPGNYVKERNMLCPVKIYGKVNQLRFYY